jgi:hypothetical protein
LKGFKDEETLNGQNIVPSNAYGTLPFAVIEQKNIIGLEQRDYLDAFILCLILMGMIYFVMKKG